MGGLRGRVELEEEDGRWVGRLSRERVGGLSRD